MMANTKVTFRVNKRDATRKLDLGAKTGEVMQLTYTCTQFIN